MGAERSQMFSKELRKKYSWLAQELAQGIPYSYRVCSSQGRGFCLLGAWLIHLGLVQVTQSLCVGSRRLEHRLHHN